MDVPGSHDFILGWIADAKAAVASFSGVPATGLGEGEGALMIDSGARMLKI